MNLLYAEIELSVKQLSLIIQLKENFVTYLHNGLIHLQGYDHEIENERIIMNNIVDEIFNPLGIKRKD